jgi:hypothetical protein
MSLWMLFILLPIRLGDLKKVAKVSLGWVIGGNAEFGEYCTLTIYCVRKGSMTCDGMCQ